MTLIGILGAGSIGGYVGGRLRAAGHPVTFVGRQHHHETIRAHGLTVQDLGGPPTTIPAADVTWATSPAALRDADLVLVCVKSGQTSSAASALELRPGTPVFSLQNGLTNAPTLARLLPDHPVIPSIVGFNVVTRDRATYHRTMDGPIAFAASPHTATLTALLDGAGVPTETHRDLAPHQWTKLLVNLNNAVSALSGAATPTLLADPTYRRVIAALVGEALAVLRAAGIRPARLRGVPIGWMPPILRMPTPIVRLVTGAQMKVDPEARSSMWEDLTRGRPTEVDHLNGAIVDLAADHGTTAPLNARIVDLVREAEAASAGPPNLPAQALWDRLHAAS